MSGEEKLFTYLNKSKLLSNVDYEKKIRIAILGGFTLNGLEETIRVKCDEKSQLYKFSPDVTFLIRLLKTIMKLGLL